MKYPRTYHFPFTGSHTNDDRIQYDYSNLIGVPIVITEKLDGENTGIVQGGVYARSHGVYSKTAWNKSIRALHSNIGMYLNEGVYLFGENMEAIHSIEYNNLDSFFYLFAVRDGSTFLSWKEVLEYAYLLDLKVVPELYSGVVNSEQELEELINSLISNGSKLGGEDIEGVVARVSNSFDESEFSNKVCKWVRPKHIKTDEHWRKNWKKAKLNYM